MYTSACDLLCLPCGRNQVLMDWDWERDGTVRLQSAIAVSRARTCPPLDSCSYWQILVAHPIKIGAPFSHRLFSCESASDNLAERCNLNRGRVKKKEKIWTASVYGFLASSSVLVSSTLGPASRAVQGVFRVGACLQGSESILTGIVRRESTRPKRQARD